MRALPPQVIDREYEHHANKQTSFGGSKYLRFGLNASLCDTFCFEILTNSNTA